MIVNKLLKIMFAKFESYPSKAVEDMRKVRTTRTLKSELFLIGYV